VESALVTTLFVVSSRFLRYSSLNLMMSHPEKGPKQVLDFFNNFKIQLCYDGHLYT
jgi:hypothetical protein